MRHRDRRLLLGVLLSLLLPTSLSAQAVRGPSLTIDNRIDAHQEDFSILGGVRVNTRGDVALGFRQDAQFRVYDASGKRIATAGRRGGGPGEFRQIELLTWIADTLVLYDPALYRFSYFSRDGKVLRSEPLGRTLRAGGNGQSARFSIVSPFAPRTRSVGGLTLGVATISATSAASGTSTETAVIGASIDGSAVYITSLPAMEKEWDFPFGPRVVAAFADDGMSVVHVRVNGMRETGGTFTVVRSNARGDTVFAMVFAYTGEAMTAKYIDSVVARGIGVDRKRSKEGARIPPVHAPVESARIGADGATWVILRGERGTKVALRLSATGGEIGRFPLPPKSELESANATHVWLRQTTDDGLQNIVRARFR